MNKIIITVILLLFNSVASSVKAQSVLPDDIRDLLIDYNRLDLISLDWVEYPDPLSEDITHYQLMRDAESELHYVDIIHVQFDDGPTVLLQIGSVFAEMELGGYQLNEGAIVMTQNLSSATYPHEGGDLDVGAVMFEHHFRDPTWYVHSDQLEQMWQATGGVRTWNLIETIDLEGLTPQLTPHITSISQILMKTEMLVAPHKPEGDWIGDWGKLDSENPLYWNDPTWLMSGKDRERFWYNINYGGGNDGDGSGSIDGDGSGSIDDDPFLPHPLEEQEIPDHYNPTKPRGSIATNGGGNNGATGPFSPEWNPYDPTSLGFDPYLHPDYYGPNPFENQGGFYGDTGMGGTYTNNGSPAVLDGGSSGSGGSTWSFGVYWESEFYQVTVYASGGHLVIGPDGSVYYVP